jgi:hypothetical protein
MTLGMGSERSVSGRDRSLAPAAKSEVETGFHDALGFVDVKDADIAESNVPAAEVVVVVLHKAGQVVGKGIFAANADGPAEAPVPVGNSGSDILVVQPAQNRQANV